MLSFIKEGVTARDAYQHALSFVAEKDPALEKHFVKNIGFGVSSFPPSFTFQVFKFHCQTGVEFRDAAYLLSAKNTRALHANMVIILGLGFNDLTDANGVK